MTNFRMPRLVRTLWPDYHPTPLIRTDFIARKLGIGRLVIKNEAARPLGNFKSLGGMTAGIRLLMDHTKVARPEGLRGVMGLPPLTCASDGNHGLAVAAAAQWAGTRGIVYLPAHVLPERVARITELGGEVVMVDGTYDDAVGAASAAASGGAGLLVPDTTGLAYDRAVAMVMEGYGLMVDELVDQISESGSSLTHIFVQAGVGGLAAALADGLSAGFQTAPRIVVVEPASANCVGLALAAGTPVQCEGTLVTSATMLSCGLASAPAVNTLLSKGAEDLALSEHDLAQGPDLVGRLNGLATTISGAAGIAGLAVACRSATMRERFGLDATSSVLTILSEGRA